MDLPIHDAPDLVESIFEALQQTVKGKKSGTISRETVIADLGIDSITLMEMIGILEDRLDVVLADEDITSIRTIGDLESLIRRRRAAGPQVEGV